MSCGDKDVLHANTVSDGLIRQLLQAGVGVIFGLPGGENIALLAAMQRQGMRFVRVHDEKSAVFMAEVTARLTGRPGACLTTLGPGVANAVAGIANAYLDRAPLLILTACMEESLRPGQTHQFLEQQQLLAPITKATYTITAANAVDVVAKAIACCSSGRPGPVHLQVGRRTADTLAELSTDGILSADEPATTVAPLAPAAALRLSQAKRPLLIAGLGLEPERPYEALLALAERLQAPVILTPKAKGAISAEHPLFAGTIGLTHTDPVYEFLTEADCIVAIGFDVVELVKPWDVAAPLIWIASWPNQDPVLPAIAESIGVMAPILDQLAQTYIVLDQRWGIKRVARLREQLHQTPLPQPRSGHLLPNTVLEVVRQLTPPAIPIAIDVGSHKILASLTWPAYVPNRFLLSNGLSCMGYGLPAAIAASLARDRQPAIVITGDGGITMALGELGLLRELETPVVVIVMRDGALDLIRSAQLRQGVPVMGTEFLNPDYVQIAAAYELAGRRVTTVPALAAAVTEALTTPKAMIIEAVIDPIGYPTTPQT